MNSQRHLSKSSFADKFHKFVVVKCCFRSFHAHLSICFDESNQFLSILQHSNVIIEESLYLG